MGYFQIYSRKFFFYLTRKGYRKTPFPFIFNSTQAFGTRITVLTRARREIVQGVGARNPARSSYGLLRLYPSELFGVVPRTRSRIPLIRAGGRCYPRHHPTPATHPSSRRPRGSCSSCTRGCSWASRQSQRWNVTTWIIHIRNFITFPRTLTSVFVQVFTIIRLCLISHTIKSVY